MACFCFRRLRKPIIREVFRFRPASKQQERNGVEQELQARWPSSSSRLGECHNPYRAERPSTGRNGGAREGCLLVMIKESEQKTISPATEPYNSQAHCRPVRIEKRQRVDRRQQIRSLYSLIQQGGRKLQTHMQCGIGFSRSIAVRIDDHIKNDGGVESREYSGIAHSIK